MQGSSPISNLMLRATRRSGIESEETSAPRCAFVVLGLNSGIVTVALANRQRRSGSTSHSVPSHIHASGHWHCPPHPSLPGPQAYAAQRGTHDGAATELGEGVGNVTAAIGGTTGSEIVGEHVHLPKAEPESLQTCAPWRPSGHAQGLDAPGAQARSGCPLHPSTPAARMNAIADTTIRRMAQA